MILDVLNLEEIRRGGPPPWVNGRIYQSGQCARSLTDQQRYVRITNGGGAVDPATDTTNWRPDGGRPIKSIQRGVVTTVGNASMSVTIAAVNPAKTEVRFLGFSSNTSAAIHEGIAYVALANSTTITVAGAQAYNSGRSTVSWELTEYY